MNRLEELKRNAQPLEDINVDVDSDRGIALYLDYHGSFV